MSKTVQRYLQVICVKYFKSYVKNVFCIPDNINDAVAYDSLF